MGYYDSMPILFSGSDVASEIAISFTDTATDTSDLTTYTFTGRAFGVAAADRVISVTIGSIFAGGRTISSVTIGGVSATNNSTAIQTGGGGESTIAAIWSAVVPTGTTGDVVVTFSGGMSRCVIGIFRMVNLANATAFTSGTDTVVSGSDLTTTTNVAAGGAVISTAFALLVSGSSSFTWTNVTEAYDSQPESSLNAASAGFQQYSAAKTSLVVTATIAGGTPNLYAMATATFAPI